MSLTPTVTGNWSAALTDVDVKNTMESIKQARSTALQELRNQGLSDDELELATDLLNNILDVVQKTVESKKLDGGVVATLAPGKATIALGAGIADGAKLERVVKQLAGIAAAEDEDLAKAMKLDAETHKGRPLPRAHDSLARPGNREADRQNRDHRRGDRRQESLCRGGHRPDRAVEAGDRQVGHRAEQEDPAPLDSQSHCCRLSRWPPASPRRGRPKI